MSKYRSIYTKFWEDSWVCQQLNPLDRYLFLYFLTNEHCNLCGIYELPMKVMAFQTGLDEGDLARSYLPRLAPKVLYKEGWVYIKNFDKYHVEGSPKLKIARDNALKALPAKIRAIFDREIKGIDTLSPFALASASAFALDNNAPPEGDIDELLEDDGRELKHEYQFWGLEIFEKTGAPLNKKSECIRLAKIYPGLIQPSLSFSIDYPNPKLRWKMFLWKLNTLKKEHDKKS